MRTGLPRRRVLGAAAGISLSATSLAGCGLLDREDETPPPPDALQPLLDEAVTLAAAFGRAAATRPALAARLTPLAADHRAHAEALAHLIGRPVPSTLASTPGTAAESTAGTAPASTAGTAPAGDAAAGDAAVLAELRRSEQAAQRTAAAACKLAPTGRAALVGSIAACRATHVEALR